MDIQSNKEYEAVTFSLGSYPGNMYSDVHFTACIFKKCDFEKAAFKKCIFNDCTFIGCNLSLLKVAESTFSNAVFKECKMIGIDWSTCRRDFSSFSFEDSMLDYSKFYNLNLKKLHLVGCSVREVNFQETNLTEADCSRTDFAGSTFHHVNFSHADFKEAKNFVIDTTVNTLTKAKFSYPEVLGLLGNLDIEIT